MLEKYNVNSYQVNEYISMQFSVMYVKMMEVNNDSGEVHNAIIRCQVQRWYMLACRL